MLDYLHESCRTETRVELTGDPQSLVAENQLGEYTQEMLHI